MAQTKVRISIAPLPPCSRGFRVGDRQHRGRVAACHRVQHSDVEIRVDLAHALVAYMVADPARTDDDHALVAPDAGDRLGDVRAKREGPRHRQVGVDAAGQHYRDGL